jgi:hypothetical protein
MATFVRSKLNYRLFIHDKKSSDHKQNVFKRFHLRQLIRLDSFTRNGFHFPTPHPDALEKRPHLRRFALNASRALQEIFLEIGAIANRFPLLHCHRWLMKCDPGEEGRDCLLLHQHLSSRYTCTGKQTGSRNENSYL